MDVMKKVLMMIFGAACLTGCNTVYNADDVPGKDLANESSVVVVRPDRYTILGTRSVRDYLEIIYEELDSAGPIPVVRIGIRNKGGQHWWDLKGKDFTIFAQAVFYRDPVAGKDVRSAPLYKTNKQAVPLERGETTDLVFKSPVKGAQGYQIIISED